MLRAQKKTKQSTDLSSPPMVDAQVSDSAAKMEEARRRWEDMDSDCLANVFSRVGMESLVLGVPFVCKSWYATSLTSPLCWKYLSFPEFDPYTNDSGAEFDSDEDEFQPKSFGPFYDEFVQVYGIDRSRFSTNGFIKLIVSRSKGEAIEVKLPVCNEDAFRYVADACPRVKVLSFPDDLLFLKYSQVVLEVVGKWKFLEDLTLGGDMNRVAALCLKENNPGWLLPFEHVDGETVMRHKTNEILEEIGTHCKHIRSLHLFDVLIREAEALTIVNTMPNLEALTLGHSDVRRDGVVALLRGCQKLSRLHFLNCEGFEEGDEELWSLASRIGDFTCEGDRNCYFFLYALKRGILFNGSRDTWE